MQKDSQYFFQTACFIVACFLITVYSSPASAQNRPKFKFTGAGACSATKCHGGVEPSEVGAIQANEYTTWSNEDEFHPVSYSALESDEAMEIASEVGAWRTQV